MYYEMKQERGRWTKTLSTDVKVCEKVIIQGEEYVVIRKDKDGVEVSKVDARDREVMEKTIKAIKFGDLI